MRRIIACTLLILLSGFIRHTFSGQCTLCNQTEVPYPRDTTRCSSCDAQTRSAMSNLSGIILEEANSFKSCVERKKNNTIHIGTIRPDEYRDDIDYFAGVIKKHECLDQNKKTTRWMTMSITETLLQFSFYEKAALNLIRKCHFPWLKNLYRFSDYQFVFNFYQLYATLGIPMESNIGRCQTALFAGELLDLISYANNPGNHYWQSDELHQFNPFTTLTNTVVWSLLMREDSGQAVATISPESYKARFFDYMQYKMGSQGTFCVSADDFSSQDKTYITEENKRLNNNITAVNNSMIQAPVFKPGQNQKMVKAMEDCLVNPNQPIFIFTVQGHKNNFIAVIRQQTGEKNIDYWAFLSGSFILSLHKEDLHPSVDDIISYFNELDKTAESIKQNFNVMNTVEALTFFSSPALTLYQVIQYFRGQSPTAQDIMTDVSLLGLWVFIRNIKHLFFPEAAKLY
ncbi:hypothetical protein CI610_00287 [invertebrate metagenome]|uniref:Uncharacterized protein n=1 Tax=invertebrate metagenome TaxID=1711999 RepID=A0A2H9TC14_9ZZZZ